MDRGASSSVDRLTEPCDRLSLEEQDEKRKGAGPGLKRRWKFVGDAWGEDWSSKPPALVLLNTRTVPGGGEQQSRAAC